jgi:cation:H+ antiporter
MSLALLWLQFGACMLLIGRAGYVLCDSADRIAGATGLARGWLGLALLATVTSLPELASGISAVTVVDAPDLAVGNALGACVFNLLFLVVVDLVHRSGPVYRSASAVHQLSAAFGVVMLGFVAMSLITGHGAAQTLAPRLLHVGLYSPALLALYLLALRSVYRHERAHAAAEPATAAGQRPPAGAAWRRFAASAAVVLAAGSWLPFVASDLAAEHGWSRSFVGTVFVALATTLPEMAVTLSALRLHALDMAIGNLLGSNLFNAMIISIDDLFYTRGPLLRDVALAHAGTAVAAVIMSGLVLVGLVFRPQGRVLKVVSWVSVGLVAMYLLNASVVFLYGG